MGLLVCVATLGLAAFGYAGIPDLDLSSAATAAGAQVSVFNQLPGTGARIDDAMLSGGATTDATVTVTLKDGNGAPVFLYPFEDIWMETSAGGMVACPGGTTADGSTNVNGQTVFISELAAGGFSAPGEQAVVVVSGAPLVGSNLDILFNSPDISGDLQVNLSDITLFGGMLAPGAAYDYAGDFYFDGTVNLSDIVLFSGGLDTVCP